MVVGWSSVDRTKRVFSIYLSVVEGRGDKDEGYVHIHDDGQQSLPPVTTRLQQQRVDEARIGLEREGGLLVWMGEAG